ncbi:flavodoxin domain-containing protein [Methylomagnum ishizawai]|uniref:flavodoxin domain-containing protein n=1 Tax=Methylomagnum ishizawai TaxID=1760988 RepID=UPI001C32714C|nr:flavodoxin domain-containing protein [Methylomagnum ishizawai]BBL73062.1 protoporphyrinogen oxidase [Methylomagnum ishizawai]
MRILIVYFTREGQTGRIAERIAARLAGAGHRVDCRAGAAAIDPAAYEAVIVGASIHYGHHSLAAHLWGFRHRKALAGRPAAFFSVSLTGGGPGARPLVARKYLDAYLSRTRWRPPLTAIFGGALPYSRYTPFTRGLVRLFVRMAGGDTDASRDYDYTDWKAVDGFAEDFLARAVAPESGATAL